VGGDCIYYIIQFVSMLEEPNREPFILFCKKCFKILKLFLYYLIINWCECIAIHVSHRIRPI